MAALEKNVGDVVTALGRRIELARAAAWDVTGLQLGDPSAPVESVGVCHEVTEVVVAALESEPVDLLVAYHPLLFRPVTYIVDGSSPAGRAFRLIRSGVALVVVHTAFDVTDGGAADQLAACLSLSDVVPFGRVDAETDGEPVDEPIGRVGSLRGPTAFETFRNQVASVLGEVGLRSVGDPGRPIRRVAVVPGSGSSFIDEAARSGADVLVTGDVSHHELVRAADSGLAVIDAGHAATERPGMDRLAATVADVAADLGIAVTRSLLPPPL